MEPMGGALFSQSNRSGHAAEVLSESERLPQNVCTKASVARRSFYIGKPSRTSRISGRRCCEPEI